MPLFLPPPPNTRLATGTGAAPPVPQWSWLHNPRMGKLCVCLDAMFSPEHILSSLYIYIVNLMWLKFDTKDIVVHWCTESFRHRSTVYRKPYYEAFPWDYNGTCIYHFDSIHKQLNRTIKLAATSLRQTPTTWHAIRCCGGQYVKLCWKWRKSQRLTVV